MTISTLKTDLPVEWLSPKQAARIFGLSRSTIYNLMSQGKLKSKSLRVLGNIRGRRLISAESLRLFIESQES